MDEAERLTVAAQQWQRVWRRTVRACVGCFAVATVAVYLLSAPLDAAARAVVAFSVGLMVALLSAALLSGPAERRGLALVEPLLSKVSATTVLFLMGDLSRLSSMVEGHLQHLAHIQQQGRRRLQLVSPRVLDSGSMVSVAVSSPPPDVFPGRGVRLLAGQMLAWVEGLRDADVEVAVALARSWNLPPAQLFAAVRGISAPRPPEAVAPTRAAPHPTRRGASPGSFRSGWAAAVRLLGFGPLALIPPVEDGPAGGGGR